MKRHAVPGRLRVLAASAACVALGALVGPASALNESRPLPGATADAIASCVGGQPLRFAPQDRRALLDAADAAAVSAALVRRYPVIERDGLSPQRLFLWKPEAAAWLFIAVVENPAQSRDVCYTATFAAARIELTAALLVKYFGAGVAQ